MRAAPYHVVDLRGGLVGEDGVLDGALARRLQGRVPYERLLVVRTGGDVLRGLRSPAHRIARCLVPRQYTGGQRGKPIQASNITLRTVHALAAACLPYIQQHDRVGVRPDGGEVVGVLLVPAHPQQRGEPGGLVQDGAVLQGSTHAHTG